jgi:DNA replication and repair protein RecF
VEVEVRASGANRVQVNRSPVRRKRDIRHRVRGVFFGPDDLAIGQGDPDRRRRFLDEAVIALWPVRDGASRAYDKALRQRNRLLKELEGGPGPEPADLAAWDGELVEAGSALTRHRAAAMTRLTGPAGEEFRRLTGVDLVSAYRPSVPVPSPPDEPDSWPPGALEDAFRSRLAERRTDELIRRTTLVGPHRDELELRLRELAVRSFASHGESWVAALALRVGLARAVEAELGEPPVLLLDDPFSGLDPDRRGRLSERVVELSRTGQVVVSVADAVQIPAGPSVRWAVLGGAVTVMADGHDNTGDGR